MKDKIKLLEYILYREVGGTGYNPAIRKLAEEYPDYYDKLQNQIKGIKDEPRTT